MKNFKLLSTPCPRRNHQIISIFTKCHRNHFLVVCIVVNERRQWVIENMPNDLINERAMHIHDTDAIANGK